MLNSSLHQEKQILISLQDVNYLKINFCFLPCCAAEGGNTDVAKKKTGEIAHLVDIRYLKKVKSAPQLFIAIHLSAPRCTKHTLSF